MLKFFGIDTKFLDDENIISKLNLLFQLERMDPYCDDSTLQERIWITMQYLPAEHRKYVLALFANTIYLPKVFSNSILQHMFNQLMFKYGIKWNEVGKKCLLLEQDPTGIIIDFLHINHIHGRLDKGTFQRTQQVKDFVKVAETNIQDGIDSSKSEGVEYVLPFLGRKFWVILVDNSLSGTSLISDVQKLIETAKRAEKFPRKIIVLIRTYGADAKTKVESEFEEYIKDGTMEIDYGLLLDERYVINGSEGQEKRCKLFNKENTYMGVVSACEWLAKQNFYIGDPLLKDHMKNSVGAESMMFGFKNCGLTYVSSENCPSDSLPLLWYDNESYYRAPFPRVLSRINGDKAIGGNK